MNLMPFADKLETEKIAVKGKSLFINMMPVTCKTGVLLRDKLTGTPIDHELPGLYRASFQVIARSPDMVAGQQLIDSVSASLTLTETQLGSMLIRYSRPVELPTVFPLSDGNIYEFNQWFEVAFNQ